MLVEKRERRVCVISLYGRSRCRDHDRLRCRPHLKAITAS